MSYRDPTNAERFYKLQMARRLHKLRPILSMPQWLEVLAPVSASLDTQGRSDFAEHPQGLLVTLPPTRR